jgi:hypothetical protein
MIKKIWTQLMGPQRMSNIWKCYMCPNRIDSPIWKQTCSPVCSMSLDWEQACEYGIAPGDPKFVIELIVDFIGKFGMDETIRFAKKNGINEDLVRDAEKWQLLA